MPVRSRASAPRSFVRRIRTRRRSTPCSVTYGNRASTGSPSRSASTRMDENVSSTSTATCRTRRSRTGRSPIDARDDRGAAQAVPRRPTGFVAPAGTTWSDELADPQGGPVICHNDVCPENVVHRATARSRCSTSTSPRPGRREYDVAQLAKMCVPLDTDEDAARLGRGGLDPFARTSRRRRPLRVASRSSRVPRHPRRCDRSRRTIREPPRRVRRTGLRRDVERDGRTGALRPSHRVVPT